MNYTIAELDQEFTEVLINSGTFHDNQRNMVSYYNNNVFYQPLPGEPKPKRNVGVNFLKAFADKNMHYMGKMPTIKKMPTGVDPQSRQQASLKEKIILSALKYNHADQLQRKLASDTTLMAEGYLLTEFDLQKRCPTIRRLDPRYCYKLFGSEVDGQMLAFWYAVPMSAEVIKSKYGIDVQASGIGSNATMPDGNPINLNNLLGRDMYYVVMRWDGAVRTVWVGNDFIEQPHNHMLGDIPIDVAAPFETGNADQNGGFFLDPLVPLNAEYNETMRRKANIIRKLSNPAVVGKGIMASQFDDVKKALSGDGGFIGVKPTGDLNFLQLQHTELLDNHLSVLFEQMKNLAGFPTATFGESIGANTSGDALSMYFQPTTQATEHQWTVYKALWEAVSAKVLRYYKIFGMTGETFEVYGMKPRGTFEMVETGVMDEQGNPEYQAQFQSGGFTVQFTAEQLQGDDTVVVQTPSATPKDQTAMQKMAMEAVSTGFLPRTYAYEMFGDIVDPEDVLNSLAVEREDPRLHPEVLAAASQALGNQLPAGAPTPTGA